MNKIESSQSLTHTLYDKKKTKYVYIHIRMSVFESNWSILRASINTSFDILSHETFVSFEFVFASSEKLQKKIYPMAINSLKLYICPTC